MLVRLEAMSGAERERLLQALSINLEFILPKAEKDFTQRDEKDATPAQKNQHYQHRKKVLI